MTLIVVGGHSRSVGKTSVVAGLIAALPEFGWTAVKITQYGDGILVLDKRQQQVFVRCIFVPALIGVGESPMQ